MILYNHWKWCYRIIFIGTKNRYRNIVVKKIIVYILCDWHVPDAVAIVVNKSKHISVLQSTRTAAHLRILQHQPILLKCCGSAGKESACSAGDPGSIPGSGRSAGEGIGYSFQYSWASLVAQWLVKNPPAMWETWIRSLGWEDPLEKGKAAHSSILAWRIPWTG